MDDFLSKTYYGNTILDWLFALLIILAAVIVGKMLYWVFSNILSKFTQRTKTKLDDLILDLIEEPVVLALTVMGIGYGLNTLTLSKTLEGWIGNGLNFAIILSVTWFLTRLFDAFYREYLVKLTAKTKTDLDDQILPILRKGTRVTIWAMGIILALNNAGYNVGTLLAGLGIGGLAVAMAAKDTISNVFGGFTIFTDHPFKVNDRIIVSGFEGFIREIGVRSTRLETLAGRIVTIPNARLADAPVENVSVEPSRKIVLKLGLTYETSPEKMQQAMQILRDIVAKHPSLEEKVIVSFTEYGDFAMVILFIYYIRKGSDIFSALTDVNMAILTEFNRAGLDFAYPTQTLYTKSV